MTTRNFQVLYVAMLICVTREFLLAAAAETTIYPTILESRDVTGEKVVRIDDSLTLTLRRSDFLGRSINGLKLQNGQMHRETVNTAGLNLYEDPKHFSSVFVHELQNGVQLRGLLTPRLHIEPLFIMRRSDQGKMAHRVTSVHEGGLPFPYESALWSLREPTLPMTVWIEVGIVSDFQHLEASGNRREHTVYLATFMRSVTLRFAGVLPRIRFRLVGIYWTDSAESEELLASPEDMSVVGNNTLERLRALVNADKNAGYPVPDIVYFITKRKNIIDYLDDTWTDHNIVTGMSYEGGVCSDHNVGMGWDDGKLYRGVDTAVRQMAHLLGAPWDADCQECHASDGYIMGNTTKYHSNGYKFSPCSERGLISTLQKRFDQDLKLKNKEGESVATRCFDTIYDSMDAISNQLPGETIDPTQFCRDAMPMKEKSSVHPCEGWFSNSDWKMDECVTRCCYGSSSKLYRQIPYKSPDGFKCFTNKKVCYAGQCVDPSTDVDTFW